MAKILFITEKPFLDGRLYFGTSNDLFLVYKALKQGLEVYLITPQDFLRESKKEAINTLKLDKNLDLEKVTTEIKYAWFNQTINCFFGQSVNPDEREKTSSKTILEGSSIEILDLNNVIIFNRSEPISLTNQLYDILINLKKLGSKVIPNPSLNKILGDKLAIEAIHGNWNDVDFPQKKIGFNGKIISISNDNLEIKDIVWFYDLLEKENHEQAQKLFPQEYETFIKGVTEYLEFHTKLGNDSVLKPLNYFGGTGIIVCENQTLTFKQAIQNIVHSFMAVKKDCQKYMKNNSSLKLVNLSKIIIQQRATKASLGDLRIIICYNKFEGVFVRVNPNFTKFHASNLHYGGHAESLFKHYEISNKGIDKMISDMKESGLEDETVEIKQAKALYSLIKIIHFLEKVEIFRQYPIIGVDALLTEDKNGDYQYLVNEINLTSPMGQTQIHLLNIAIEFNKEALKILNENGFKINLKKYQILSDYFKEIDFSLIDKARNILSKNLDLKDLIDGKVEKILGTKHHAKSYLKFSRFYT